MVAQCGLVRTVCPTIYWVMTKWIFYRRTRIAEKSKAEVVNYMVPTGTPLRPVADEYYEDDYSYPIAAAPTAQVRVGTHAAASRTHLERRCIGGQYAGSNGGSEAGQGKRRGYVRLLDLGRIEIPTHQIGSWLPAPLLAPRGRKYCAGRCTKLAMR